MNKGVPSRHLAVTRSKHQQETALIQEDMYKINMPEPPLSEEALSGTTRHANRPSSRDRRSIRFSDMALALKLWMAKRAGCGFWPHLPSTFRDTKIAG